MIIFDGVDLESIAPVKIEDIRVGQVEVEPVARPRAVFPGSELVRVKNGQRKIVITFGVLEDDQTQRQTYLRRISEWAKNDKEYKLELPNRSGCYLMCMCTGKPEPSLRQWWEANLQLVFTCVSDPFWISNNAKSADCGVVFSVLGDAMPIMWIERTLSLPATNQSYSCDGKTMTFSAIPAGNMTIDLTNQTAKVGSTSFMNNYLVTSSFIIPHTGSMKITGTGQVLWRERWQ